MNSGIYRFYKRLTAMLLAICMIAGLVMGQPNILSYASTELQNEDLGDGASEATAYTWKNGSVTGQGGEVIPGVSTLGACRQGSIIMLRLVLKQLTVTEGMQPGFRSGLIPNS